MPTRIYLDNAATSWPKRQSVLHAATDFMQHCGASAGRGAYSSAQQADRWLVEGRRNLAALLGAGDPASIAFCSSGTHALNAALSGLLRQGDHVIATEQDHNSLLRPLFRLQQSLGITVDYARCDDRGFADPDHARSLLKNNTRMIALGHASNVTGIVQQLVPWKNLARDNSAILLVDASQSLGYLPVDVINSGIDVLASAGHKGLGGLPGTGLLYLSRELQREFRPLMTGGTGVSSESIDASIQWPQSVEVGNYNLPGIISMAVAAKELSSESKLNPVPWQVQWRGPLERLIQGLRQFSEVSIIGHSADDATQGIAEYVPIVSVQVSGWSAHDLASVLDSAFHIEVRAGFHCAALVHQALRTQIAGGTLRISLGHTTTNSEIDTLLVALREILNSQSS